MKTVFYILIAVIIAYCLFSTLKTKEKFAITDATTIPDSPVIKSVTYDNGLRIKWSKPLNSSNIANYIIFIKNNNNINDNIYLKFTNLSDCIECEYYIDNLNLESNKYYYASVIAVDQNGATSNPTDLIQFFIPDTTPSTTPSILPSTTPSISIPVNTDAPSSVLASSVTPTPSSQSSYDNTMTLEDRIKMGEDARKIYLDNELQNMVARANGIYEINSDQLQYPDVFLSDIKQSINTMNDMVKKDLQEYRVNVHLTSQN
jgi:hypothetical protein